MKKFTVFFLIFFSTLQGYSQIIETSLPPANLVKSFYESKNLDDKVNIFNSLLKVAPEGSSAAKEVNYDDMRRILAINYLQKDSLERYQHYVETIRNKLALAEEFDKMTSHFTANKRMAAFAEKPATSMVQLIGEIAKNPSSYKPVTLTDGQWNKQINEKVVRYKTRLALILYRQDKYEEAEKLLKPLYIERPSFNPDVYELYAKILSALGDAKQSMSVINKVFDAGYRTEDLMQTMKDNYVKIHGSENGYEIYLNDINKLIQVKIRERLRAEMTNKQAPSFTLKDSNGNVVSLTSLKGKTIIIDFWATWCTPCKESFPASQRVVDRYKDDSTVQFMFIDTWENANNYKELAMKYISDSKFNFDVYFDKQDPKTNKQNLVANAFRVESIPTRIIIDKHGKICFTENGYSGSTDQMAEDLTTMVELAKNR
ncbi:redoxin family protein [Mucilaginibacter daejeonensis]|uniref:redoxin domain-containing protein n=1 Tax=Mucilaginibacter daejeonensis TaxID=398049 RepID=UPI001D17D12B|nr:redoxin domain-containing protein [Mucilaginibacter daejeonensis]UEG51478.1 redoxin family protein [Mucilaginibacter daejeonensis]